MSGQQGEGEAGGANDIGSGARSLEREGGEGGGGLTVSGLQGKGEAGGANAIGMMSSLGCVSLKVGR